MNITPEHLAARLIRHQCQGLKTAIELLRHAQAMGLTVEDVAATLERTVAAVEGDRGLFDRLVQELAKEGPPLH